MSSPLVADESRRTYAGWRVAWAGAAGVFFASIIVVTFPILLRAFVTEFGWARRDISSAFALAALGAAAGAVPLGVLLDRVGPRRVVVPSLLLVGLLFGSLAFVDPGLPRLQLTYALLGLAGIGASPVAYARTVSLWFDAQRGLALGIVIAGGALGGIVHPPVAEALFHTFGWRSGCLAFGAAVILVGVPATLWLLPAGAPPGAVRHDAEGASLGAGLRRKRLWMLVAVQFCGTLLQNAVIVHLFALLIDRGVPPARAAIAMSAMALAAFVGRLTTGVFIDRISAVRVLSTLLIVAGLGATLLSGVPVFIVAVLGVVLIGSCTGGEADVIPYLLSRYFGMRAFSALFGVAWMANAIGGALGPILMGWAFDFGGTYDGMLMWLSWLMMFAGLATLTLPGYSRSISGVISAARR